MIRMVANNWEDAWVDIHRQLSVDPKSIIDKRFATRAVSFDNQITITNNDIGKLTIGMVGYTSYKLNLFDHRYIIAGMKEKILATLQERVSMGRKLTVMSYPFKADDGAHTQGPCVINILITMTHDATGWHLEFDIYARIGEITRRLLVDFIKFSEIIAFFQQGLLDYKVDTKAIHFNAKALYAESLSLTIAEYTFKNQFRFDKNYWLHLDVQKKLVKFETQEMKFKRGRRIRNQVHRLQGEQT